MLVRLLAVLLLAPAVPAQDDPDAERAFLRQALTLLAERPTSEELVATYEELHGRAWRLGDVETAQAAVERIVSWWEQTLGPGSLGLAERLTGLAIVLDGHGDYAGARLCFECAIEIREAALGPDHVEVARSLANLALLLGKLGQYDAERPLRERVLAIREAALGPDHLDVSASVTDLAVVHDHLGEYAQAQPLFERALAIRRAALDPGHPDIAKSLGNLALLLGKLGQYDAARSLHERVLAIREAALGPDHLDVSASVTDLAVVHAHLGEYAQAQPLFERALAIRRAALDPGHPDIAISLGNLALVLQALGDHARARPLLEQNLAILEATYGPDSPRIGNSLNNLANQLRYVGDYAGARSLYERVLAIREAALGPDDPDVAVSLANLAVLLTNLGDYAAARSLHERALAIRETTLGPGHPDVALSLSGLANVLQLVGDAAEARPLHERALAIWEATLGPDHPRVAIGLNNLASVLDLLGDSDAGRPLYERSVAIWEAALGPGHPDVAIGLGNLANLLRRTGDFAGARPLYERALAIREAALGSGHPLVGSDLRALAELQLDAGDAAEAHRVALRLAGQQGRVRQTLAALTEGEAWLYLARERESRTVLLTTAKAVGDTAAAYAMVLDTKGQVARLTLQTRAQIREALDPETLARLERLARLQARLSRLALETEVRDRQAHEEQVEALQVERDGLERELRRRAEVEEGPGVLPGDVAAALPPSTAVVDLLVHPVYVPPVLVDGVVVGSAGVSAPRVSAWVVRAGEDGVRHVDLGPLAEIEVAVRAFLEDLVARRGVSVSRDASGPDANATLRALVWDPLEPHLDGVDTVFLSPDGVLSTLPYETLVDARGRFLIERHAFVYPTDVASMVARAGHVDPLADAAPPLLSMGGVDFRRRAALPGPGTDGGVAQPPGGDEARDEANEARRGGFAGYWGPLPATTYEAQVVAAMHEDAFGDGAPRLLLQGADATEELLEAELPRHAILHLATHGFFQPEGLPSMWEQALDAVSGERGMQMTESAARLTGLHPGLLSGLVLAGANRPPDDEDRDDGYLTASEVTLLDLSGVDLVVLSACETGLGRPESGEGLLGLRRAFHMAGAQTVISSLWSVKDESTSELMQGFYANLLFRGMGRHEALRAAQLDMLARNRMEHGAALPSTWGAFVLSGEWR